MAFLAAAGSGSLTAFHALRASAADTGQWQLTRNGAILPDSQIQSLADPDASLPDLVVTYTKGYSSGASYSNEPAWTATRDFNPALNLSQATRFTCTFQANAGNGWYSGYWELRLTDAGGHAADYMIDKEAWRTGSPVFVEQALTGMPTGFDAAHAVKAQILGTASTQAQSAVIKVSRLTFDTRPLGEADARRRAAWKALQAAAPRAAAFFVHALPASAKPYRDDWQSSWSKSQTIAPVQMHAARGGQDDCQIAVLPSRSAASVIGLRVTAFVGPNGAKIAPSQVTLSQMLWVPSLPEGRPDIYVGWYPDILKPITDAALLVNLNTLSDLWVDAQAPREAPPGIYHGSIVMTQGATKRAVPISLTVHRITLPERPTLTTSFWLLGENVGVFQGVSSRYTNLAACKPYVDAALANEVTPVLYAPSLLQVTPQGDSAYNVDLSQWEEYYRYVMSRGGNVIDLGNDCWFGNRFYKGNQTKVYVPGETPADMAKQEPGALPPHRRQLMKSYLDRAHAFLNQHGWDQYSYLQLYDEEASRADIMTVAYPAVKSVSPSTRIAQTQLPLPEYARWVDIPIPALPAVDNPADPQGYVQSAKAQGKHPWFYSCLDYGITIPEVGIRDRLLPLLAFRSGAEGYLFWALNWRRQPESGFPARPWAEYRSATGVSPTMGDGILIYPPATPGGSPMPSTRLKNFRDGMEDYEFLHTLSMLYAQKKDRLTPAQQAAVQGVLSLDTVLAGAWQNPGMVTRRRADAGQWIDTLSRL